MLLVFIMETSKALPLPTKVLAPKRRELPYAKPIVPHKGGQPHAKPIAPHKGRQLHAKPRIPYKPRQPSSGPAHQSSPLGGTLKVGPIPGCRLGVTERSDLRVDSLGGVTKAGLSSERCRLATTEGNDSTQVGTRHPVPTPKPIPLMSLRFSSPPSIRTHRHHSHTNERHLGDNDHQPQHLSCRPRILTNH